ncbi:hypothetical protein [Streptomyces sp. NPDC101150]|uniref:hypothetical protein n=1 Tax=Streptomyces sp. NPDC101150 TaxID=3366114 RepID=UPI003807DB15
MTAAGDGFAAEVEAWSGADWDEYVDRVQAGEASTQVIDAINRRRRQSWESTSAEAAL